MNIFKKQLFSGIRCRAACMLTSSLVVFVACQEPPGVSFFHLQHPSGTWERTLGVKFLLSKEPEGSQKSPGRCPLVHNHFHNHTNHVHCPHRSTSTEEYTSLALMISMWQMVIIPFVLVVQKHSNQTLNQTHLILNLVPNIFVRLGSFVISTRVVIVLFQSLLQWVLQGGLNTA